MNRNLLKALGLSVLMMSRDREAPAGGGTVPAPAGDAAKTPAGAPAAEKAKAEPKPYVSPVVVGGRMNLVFVHLIRNVEPKDAAVAELAKKYGTTVGKVVDIRKGNTFKYLTADFKPSATDIEAAKATAKVLNAKHASDIETVVAKLKPASAEEVAKFEASRASTRTPRNAKPAEGAAAAPAATDKK